LLGELGGGEGVAAIERGLRDLAGKVMANPDVQNLGDSIRTGALKVCRGGPFERLKLTRSLSDYLAQRVYVRRGIQPTIVETRLQSLNFQTG
jgi:hypothetical protein